MTTLPVIGVPIKGDSSILDGLEALLSIVEMPPGIPVATVGVNATQNAAILATQILAVSDEDLQKKVFQEKENLKEKIRKANTELAEIKKYEFKTN
jgi:5-(carboxyamino)imidazole ribonucleotide mutase